MLLFADCGNIKQLKEMEELGILSGITTNPVILSRESSPPVETIAKICQAFPEIPVFAQTNALICDDIVEGAVTYAKISPKLVIKIPACAEGFKAFRKIRKEKLCPSLNGGCSCRHQYKNHRLRRRTRPGHGKSRAGRRLCRHYYTRRGPRCFGKTISHYRVVFKTLFRQRPKIVLIKTASTGLLFPFYGGCQPAAAVFQRVFRHKFL